MPSNEQQRHLSRAQLHAYARGEVDPARKTVIEAHLGRCSDCREQLRQVEGMTQLLGEMGAADLDDLRWRRIRDAVRHQLEVDAQQPTTVDVMSGRRWVVPALAAAAVVGFMVWAGVVARDTGPQVAGGPSAPNLPDVSNTGASSDGQSQPEGAANQDAQQLASGAAPLTVTLASGARLELEPRTRVRAITPFGPQIELALSVGALRVRLPQRPGPGQEPVLTTPGFRVVAQSDDFSAGFWSDHFFIDVRTGQVRVDGVAFAEGEVIRAGQRREIRQDRRPQDTAPRKLPGKKRKTNPPSELSASAERTVVSKSEQGSVVVDVEPPADPVLTLWRETTDAYYRQRDLSKAVEGAERVVKLGGPHARAARQLLCDAQIALGNGARALSACKAVLGDVRSEEGRRNIHYTIGTIYRALLSDCANAIQHYNRALVFGRQHLLDDEVRVFRATCALEVGDIALAERDVESLSARAGRLARPEEVTLLQRRLASAKKARNDASTTTE